MGGHVDRGRIGVKVLNHPELVDAVRVVPAVPTFAVDGGFWYLARWSGSLSVAAG
jgi:hypothetical protein